VVVTAIVNISAIVLAMGDHFLGKKVCPKKTGVTGIIGCCGKLGYNRIEVLILECWIRMEIGYGLSVSESCLL
jgi:hypothetical protein